ncbi:MAG: 7-cyano-7-deazaguanine synthase, partial [Planctomycetota bacterium]
MIAAHPTVVCLSGGMDSTSLLLKLIAEERKVFGISFDYGQKHRIELSKLEANLTYLHDNGCAVDWHLVDLSTVTPLLHSALTQSDWSVPTGHYESDNMKETVVPNRNAIF